ncbi:MAG: hypothetical protein SVT52_08675 [Planctomycetota bacterium]|nr:hypothetical protein [Planctomycetota bacterium]
MRTRLAIPVAIILAACQVQAEISVTMKAASQQDASVLPYRSAKLTIDNDDESAVIRAVSLRPGRGGPRWILPVLVPPKTSQSVTAALPAVAPEQIIHISVLDGEPPAGNVIAQQRATIRWPAKLLTGDESINPALYNTYEYDIPGWPEGVLRGVFLAAVLASLAAAAALFIKAPLAKLIVLLLIVATSSAAVYRFISRTDVLISRQIAGPHAAGKDRLLVLSCRRTCEYVTDSTSLVPLYYSRRQMADDTMVVHAGRGTRVPISPKQVRLFWLIQPRTPRTKTDRLPSAASQL